MAISSAPLGFCAVSSLFLGLCSSGVESVGATLPVWGSKLLMLLQAVPAAPSASGISPHMLLLPDITLLCSLSVTTMSGWFASSCLSVWNRKSHRILALQPLLVGTCGLLMLFDIGPVVGGEQLRCLAPKTAAALIL